MGRILKTSNCHSLEMTIKKMFLNIFAENFFNIPDTTECCCRDAIYRPLDLDNLSNHRKIKS